tara:strand:+ start:1292 stop:1918 length:627 start_codon:yes stop_codon:yes gene_type:complete
MNKQVVNPSDSTMVSNNTMFRVPFKHYSIANWAQRKENLLKVLPTEGYTDFFTNKQEGIPDYMDTVGEVISECMQDFSNTYPVPVMITSVWCERAEQYDAHGPHNHGATGYSCILYVEYDPFVHEPTRFFAPFGDPANGDMLEYSPKIKEGDLIVFPSFLLHEAPLNKSKKKRTIVSFNIMGEDIMKAYYSGLEKKPLTKPVLGDEKS